MAGIKGKSGGKRKGSGRTSIFKKETQKLIKMSDQSRSILKYYSENLGICESDIIESLCLLYLQKDNKDITHCPQCGKPLAWEAIISVMGCDVECECGYETYVGEKIDLSNVKGISISSLNDLDKI